MRLSKTERNTIKNAILSLDKKAKIFLFGSRTDDKKKGGDIDILVLSKKLKEKDKWKIEDEIFNHIEEQKIDIIVTNDVKKSAFTRYVFSQSVKL